MVEDPPEEVFDHLQEAGVNQNPVDSQGMIVFDYWDDAHVGYYRFEEITRWIDLQLYGERYVLHGGRETLHASRV